MASLQTFIEYTVYYELYDSWDVVYPVESRDLAAVKKSLKDLLQPYELYPNIVPFEFKLFEARIDTNGKPTGPRVHEVSYRQADRIMSLDDYKKKIEPTLAAEEKIKTTAYGRFMQELLSGPTLRSLFREACQWGRPVRDSYIQSVRTLLRDAKIEGIKYVSLNNDDHTTPAQAITENMVVFNKDLKILYPPTVEPAPPIDPHTPWSAP